MKHLLIVNPCSGENKKKLELEKTIKEAFNGLDYEIHYTKQARESIEFLKEYFKDNNNDVTRVYACGGDGTINEVTNGLVGISNAELAIYPIGTGNDFIKSYAPRKIYDEIVNEKTAEKRFLVLSKLINGKTQEIDLTKISGKSLDRDWYSINVVNFGFDAIVGAMGNFYKEHGIPSDAKKDEVNDPYKYALNHDAMKHGRFNNTIVYADGKKLNEKQLLLGTVAQGQFVGGTFWCAPNSDNTDGLLDVCVLKTMSLLSLGLKYIKPYTKGKHLSKKMGKIIYLKAKKVSIDAPKEIDVCVDGEMIKGSHFELEVVPHAIRLVIPE